LLYSAEGIFFAFYFFAYEKESPVRVSFAFLMLAVALAWTDKTFSSVGADQGEHLYTQYCSSCHGKSGRGDGSVGRYLNIKVPDLTLLKNSHKGIYPLEEVMAAIDGRRSVRAHGDRQMPVWGELFRKEAENEKYSELTSLLKARMIAEYVAQLQR
jgi:Cytochrome C oxidase, cbb3-type, subunit III